MTDKTDANLEQIYRAIGELAERLDKMERPTVVVINDNEPNGPALKREVGKTLQADWQSKSDLEMFAIESAKVKLDVVLGEIKKEVGFARSKFPGDNVTFAALVEEVGELATAVFSQSRAEVRKEAVQVAAMAIRVILDGDCTFGDWRLKFNLDPLIEPPQPTANTGALT